MTHIIAKFSNGFEDTYKGNRAVKAAWMITCKETGKVLASGHSLDRTKAAKTASGNLTNWAGKVGVTMEPLDVPGRLYVGADYGYLYKRARENGYTGGNYMAEYKRFARKHNAERKAAIEAATTVEIIDL